MTPDQSKRRAQESEAITKFIQVRGAWVTSVPGAGQVAFEAPVDSSGALAAELAKIGYRVEHVGRGARLVPGGTVEIITTRSTGGTLVQRERQHAGFIEVDRFQFWLP